MPYLNYNEGEALHYEKLIDCAIEKYGHYFSDESKEFDIYLIATIAADVLRDTGKFIKVLSQEELNKASLNLAELSDSSPDFVIFCAICDDVKLSVIINVKTKVAYLINPRGKITKEEIKSKKSLKLENLSVRSYIFSNETDCFQKPDSKKTGIHLAAIIIGIINSNIQYDLDTQTLKSCKRVLDEHYQQIDSQILEKIFCSELAKQKDFSLLSPIKRHSSNATSFFKSEADLSKLDGFLTIREVTQINKKITNLEIELNKKTKKYIKIEALEQFLSDIKNFSTPYKAFTNLEDYIRKGAFAGRINSRTKKLLTSLSTKNSLEESDKNKVTDLIKILNKEVDRRTNKRIKIMALKDLLQFELDNYDFSTKKSAIEKIRKEYPRVEEGFFRQETKQLLISLLKETETEKNDFNVFSPPLYI